MSSWLFGLLYFGFLAVASTTWQVALAQMLNAVFVPGLVALALVYFQELRELGVRVERHDVTADPPVGTQFDLIHARVVLEHLPARQEVLLRLASWLRPGGWLLIEDVSFVPAAAARSVVERVSAAAINVLASTVGTDLTWARTLPLPLEEAGLAEVDAVVSSQVLRGGNALAAMVLASIRALAPMLLPSGLVSKSDLDEYAELLADPAFVDHSVTTVAAWGRRPVEPWESSMPASG